MSDSIALTQEELLKALSSKPVESDPLKEESHNQFKHKERTPEEIKSLTVRLNRIEGQIRGIKRMIAENDYCIDILTQVSAANAALNSFSKELLANHIRGCVTQHVRNGDDEIIDELVATLQKLMK